MNYRRNFQPGGTYFFTVVTYQRHELFRDIHAIHLFRQIVRQVKNERPFNVQAWVILPDHIHMIWTLDTDDSDFSGRWAKIKSLFTRQWLAQGGYEGRISNSKQQEKRRGVWQSRFIEHTIRDEDDFIAHVEYIHYNPVKHEYVDCPKNWQWSSFQWYAENEIYPRDWCCGNEERLKTPKPLGYQGLE